MKQTLSALLALAVLAALPACKAPESPTPAVEQPTPPPVTEANTPPITPSAPSPTTPDGPRDVVKWNGYDGSRFGMDEVTFRKAWGGDLKKDAPSKGATCHHVYPAWTKVPAELAFMFEDGKFVRYSTESATLVAPGGGKVGMTKAEIAQLYAGSIEEQAHKYSDGQYLRIKAVDGNSVLIFETDGKTDAAKVTEWRVGLPPQIDYVEGCS